MIAQVWTAGLEGVEGFPVTVECRVTKRLPQFSLVGLPDGAVKEAKERVQSALESSGIPFPEGEILLNLAPADKRKMGSSYDLALLVALLKGSGALSADLSGCCFLGELSLSGAVRPVQGVLCMCLAARAAGLHTVFVPKENAPEASVAQGLTVYGVETVAGLLGHLSGIRALPKTTFDRAVFEREVQSFPLDFSEVKGQEKAKRAMEIAAAGGLNLLMLGSPGTGKSMLAKRLPSILPPLTYEEALLSTAIHSGAGILPAGKAILTARPFRSPHHTMSAAALAGGGMIPRPGEISLSHNGVLFLDELPEFSKQVTETLRQPLEDGEITITRAAGRYTFPSRFMLVCAMNPCRCGYYGHPTHPCSCRKEDIRKYLGKISGPLLDRIDLQIEVAPVTFDELSAKEEGESSAAIRERVVRARNFARQRYLRELGAGTPTEKLPELEAMAAVFSNAAMTPAQIRRFCRMEEEAESLLRDAFQSLGLSARGHDRILRVARTIADLEGRETIGAGHIAEAIQLRSLDRKYF